MVPATSATFDSNLAALRCVQPTIAAIIEATSIPDNICPAVGRDDSPTYLIKDQQAGPAWFGQSSMPRISSEAMLGVYQATGSSVVLPGVLTGYEIGVLASRIPSFCAIYVIEEDIVNLRLALELHDYVELLAQNRLLFFLRDDLPKALGRFVKENPGYEVPSQLFPAPQLSSAEMAALEGSLQDAAAVAREIQVHILGVLRQSLRNRASNLRSESPRVAVISNEASQWTFDHAQRVANALDFLGWSYEVCVPNTPALCHTVARLDAVNRASADFVLFLNCRSDELESALPTAMPRTSWYLPGSVIHDEGDSGEEACSITFASSLGQIRSNQTANDRDSSFRVCPVGASEAVCDRFDKRDPDVEKSFDIAVFAEVPSATPASCGVSLESHIRLWEEMNELVSNSIDRYSNAIAYDLLEDAQRRSGVKLEDPSIREHFVALLRFVIAPTVLARSTDRALVKQDVRYAVWGSNWPDADSERTVLKGPIPEGTALADILASVSVVLLSVPSEFGLQLALDSLAVGVPVLQRKPFGVMESAFPQLGELEPFLPVYSTMAEMCQQLHEILCGNEKASEYEENSREARKLVRSRHMTANRIQYMFDTLLKTRVAKNPELQLAKP